MSRRWARVGARAFRLSAPLSRSGGHHEPDREGEADARSQPAPSGRRRLRETRVSHRHGGNALIIVKLRPGEIAAYPSRARLRQADRTMEARPMSDPPLSRGFR